MSMRTPFPIIDFIYEYEKHVCLWNTTHPSYRNKDCRDASIDAIAMAMGPELAMSRKDVTSKIQYIRARFLKEATRMPNYISPETGRYNRPDWYMAMERFMKFANQNLLAIQPPPPPASLFQPNMRPNPNIPMHRAHNQTFQQEFIAPPPKRIRFAQQMQVIHMLEQSMHNAVKSLKSIADQPDEPNNNNMPQNEFEAFGQNVSLQLQMLPTPVALKCQEKILGILKLHRMHPNMPDEMSVCVPTPSSSASSGFNYIDTTDEEQPLVIDEQPRVQQFVIEQVTTRAEVTNDSLRTGGSVSNSDTPDEASVITKHEPVCPDMKVEDRASRYIVEDECVKFVQEPLVMINEAIEAGYSSSCTPPKQPDDTFEFVDFPEDHDVVNISDSE